MTDVADDARVEVAIIGLPFPAGVSLDNGPTITPEGVALSGAEAKDAEEALLEHPQVSEENIRVTVLEEPETGEEPGTEEKPDLLAEAVGEETAADLREQVGIQTLTEAQETPSEDLQAVNGVGPKTVEKIRDAEVS